MQTLLHWINKRHVKVIWRQSENLLLASVKTVCLTFAAS